MAVGIVCLVVASLANSVAPYLFGKVIDSAIPKQINWLTVPKLLITAC